MWCARPWHDRCLGNGLVDNSLDCLLNLRLDVVVQRSVRFTAVHTNDRISHRCIHSNYAAKFRLGLKRHPPAACFWACRRYEACTKSMAILWVTIISLPAPAVGVVLVPEEEALHRPTVPLLSIQPRVPPGRYQRCPERQRRPIDQKPFRARDTGSAIHCPALLVLGPPTSGANAIASGSCPARRSASPQLRARSTLKGAAQTPPPRRARPLGTKVALGIEDRDA